MDAIYLEELKKICVSAGFIKKRDTFFRIVGDGVLQVVKCQHERRLRADLICIALHSMYSQLRPQCFSAAGCGARHSVVNCAEQNDRPQVFTPDQQTQLQMLQDRVIPWLNGIDTQKKLVCALNKLDRTWNDSTKIGPYLACGEHNHAKRVIKEIIGVHAFAKIQQVSKREETVEKLLERVYQEQEPYFGIIEIINRGSDAIDAYLRTNDLKNRQYAGFIYKESP